LQFYEECEPPYTIKSYTPTPPTQPNQYAQPIPRYETSIKQPKKGHISKIISKIRGAEHPKLTPYNKIKPIPTNK